MPDGTSCWCSDCGYVGSAVARAAASDRLHGCGHDAFALDSHRRRRWRARRMCCPPCRPTSAGDPVLARYAEAIAAAPQLRWIGYLSTTGVYGDRGGGWVDEDTVRLADVGPRAGGGWQAEAGLAAIGRSPRGRSVPPGGHLWARALGVRRSACGDRAARRQARPYASAASIATTSCAP